MRGSSTRFSASLLGLKIHAWHRFEMRWHRLPTSIATSHSLLFQFEFQAFSRRLHHRNHKMPQLPVFSLRCTDAIRHLLELWPFSRNGNMHSPISPPVRRFRGAWFRSMHTTRRSPGNGSEDRREMRLAPCFQETGPETSEALLARFDSYHGRS